jgi:hypothetical protein
MIARKAVLSTAAICFSAAVLLPAGAQAAAAPAWSLTVNPIPSNFAPGATPEPQYLISATNIGGAPTTSDPVTLNALLPGSLTPTGFDVIDNDRSAAVDPECKITGQEISCKTTEPLHQGRLLLLTVDVAVSAAEGTYETEASVKGGGTTEVITRFPTKVQASPLSFDFLPGFQAPTTDEEGAATMLAGSHPYQQTVAFGFPTVNPGDGQTNDGHPRDFTVSLPRGMVGDPAASAVLCTEAELTGSNGCPDASQVGLADVTTLFGSVGTNAISTTPLYNMVPPPGAVAELATNVADVGIYAHVLAGVRSDSDYGIDAKTPDVLALGTQPIFSIQAQIWGDPSAEAHDRVRGKCVSGKGTCEVLRGETAFLTMPGDCPGTPLPFKVRADTWEEPSPPFKEHEAEYKSADLGGNPVSVNGCGDEEIAFNPTIEARPTTNVTDSPAGLDFILHQSQNVKLDSRSPSPLRDAAIRFPAGLTVNPAQASGLGACTEAQIGFKEETEEGRLDFSKAPQSCPNAAKIGTLEVTSPALVARNEEHEVEKDLEEHPVLEPLHGSVYIASPFANPFESLVAVYLVVEDEKTGIVAKLAGEGELDPQTGQITTYFEENPEMPLEDIKVHIFGGDRGAFITPSTCGKYTTESDLVPWSAPEGEEAFPESSFQMSAAPGGRPCPATEAQMPSAFKFNAGSENPTAGKYSPLLFKLSREDGTQRLSKIESTLPRGLIASLAGVGTCSEADIAKARSREAPEKGALEQADPSCPASSRVGTVIGAAGAGPTPYYTQGNAYLAGPYKGAPVSIVAIVPAVAGPFDLGTVVSRIAVYLDPVTAEVRAVSDPLPTTLDGIPLDLRSVALRADRPNFSLNPTSCAEKSFGGSAVSTLGQAVPLSERFQVGGCKSLPYKPKLSVHLYGPTHRGAHPRLKAVLTAKAGEANTAKVSFAFPKSEFIDQAHFRTICTRVQFAANQCPAGSVYGHVKVISPLVDYPLEGPAYLRSSTHQLPDLVIALHGPPSQPIEIDAAGRVDSVNGGLRVRFEEVPDAPVTKLIFSAQGAKKGLFQNSTNICKGTHRATLKLDAQSGKVSDSQPKLVAQCPKGSKKRAKNLHRSNRPVHRAI